MIIIPAIDIKGGRCVRLFQGRMDQETIYSHDPLDTARRWEEMGAEMLHLVDLDGAVSGRPVNGDLIGRIISTLRINVQVGGGIRDAETARDYLSAGAGRVVLGTAVVNNLEFVQTLSAAFPGKIVIGIDASDGMVAVKGWTEMTGVDAMDMARRFEGSGVRAIVFTDIKRDGTLTGPNLESIERLVSVVKIPIIASGGISGIEDIRALLGIKKPGVEGVIVGKALYSGAIDLREAIALCR